MAELSRELVLETLEAWGRYAGAFRALPVAEQTEFLKKQGYASLRDLLAHVGVWWEEGRGVITDTLKHGERQGRRYDFDEFNAAAIKRFQDTPEAEFMTWYEAERQRMIDLVSGLTDAQLQVRRIQTWLDGVVLEHLKVHGVDAPSFLVIDMLKREWADYRGRYALLGAQQQTAFLQKQGFERFRDLLAHITAWWEQGIEVVENSTSEDPCEVEDVDAFNARAVERFAQLEEAAVLTQFENTRLTLANLTDMLPAEVMAKRNVQSWLRADVIDHYYEHAIQG